MKKIFTLLLLTTVFVSCKKEEIEKTPPINLVESKFEAKWGTPTNGISYYQVLRFITANQVQYYTYYGIDTKTTDKEIFNYTVQNPESDSPTIRIYGTPKENVAFVKANQMVDWNVSLVRNITTKLAVSFTIDKDYYTKVAY